METMTPKQHAYEAAMGVARKRGMSRAEIAMVLRTFVKMEELREMTREQLVTMTQPPKTVPPRM